MAAGDSGRAAIPTGAAGSAPSAVPPGRVRLGTLHRWESGDSRVGLRRRRPAALTSTLPSGRLRRRDARRAGDLRMRAVRGQSVHAQHTGHHQEQTGNEEPAWSVNWCIAEMSRVAATSAARACPQRRPWRSNCLGSDKPSALIPEVFDPNAAVLGRSWQAGEEEFRVFAQARARACNRGQHGFERRTWTRGRWFKSVKAASWGGVNVGTRCAILGATVGGLSRYRPPAPRFLGQNRCREAAVATYSPSSVRGTPRSPELAEYGQL